MARNDADYLARIDDLRRVNAAVRFISFEPLLGSVAGADLTGIHWTIVGGESGPRARPMSEDWVGGIEAACRKAATAFFFKQWGVFAKRAPVGTIAVGHSMRCRVALPVPVMFSSASALPSHAVSALPTLATIEALVRRLSLVAAEGSGRHELFEDPDPHLSKTII